MVVGLVVVVTSVAADFKAVASMVADKSQVVLVPAVVASASVERGSEAGFRTLKAQDPAFLRLGVRRTRSPRSMLLAHKLRLRQLQGGRISAPSMLATILWRVMMQT